MIALNVCHIWHQFIFLSRFQRKENVSRKNQGLINKKSDIMEPALVAEVDKIYSRTSMARTPMARLPRLFRTHS